MAGDVAYNSDKSYAMVKDALSFNLIPTTISPHCLKKMKELRIEFIPIQAIEGLQGMKAEEPFRIKGKVREYHKYLYIDNIKFRLYYFPLSEKKFITCISTYWKRHINEKGEVEWIRQ